MKTNAIRSLLAVVGACTLTLAVLAQDPAVTFDSVAAKGGKSFGRAAGQETELTNSVTFAPSIVINTNATFKVGTGAERTLKEGQVLSNDGRLTDIDGTISPVVDHLTKKNNQITVVKDGVAAPLSAPLTLGDGSVVTTDGYMTVEGKRRFIVEGQIIQLSGEKIAAVDTATLVNGQVQVQKDGTLYKLTPKASITMNDGTRIYGDGRVITLKGAESRLSEGAVLRIEGVVTK